MQKSITTMLVVVLGTAAVVLLPFLYYGTMGSVIDMYLSVPRIHAWLTGCAHNIWWLVQPVPPFFSDRVPLVFGLNGLMIGLGSFTVVCLALAAKLLRRSNERVLIHSCAYLAFVFFMIVTEIHENHLYAMFPFLAIFVPESKLLRRVFCALTVTFALDMVLTLLYLNTGFQLFLGPIRISIVNALANTTLLLIWTYHFFFSSRSLPSS